MTTPKIVLRSSLAGTLPSMISILIWMIIFGITLAWTMSSLNDMVIKASAEVGRPLSLFSLGSELGHNEMLPFVLKSVLSLFSTIVLIVAFFALIDCFYQAKTVNVIDLTKKTLSSRTISFPFSQSEKNVRIDRLTTIEVDQSTLERLIGVGTIKLSYLRHENFESAHDEWEIPYLEDPMQLKSQLEELLSLGGAEQLDLRQRPNTRT